MVEVIYERGGRLTSPTVVVKTTNREYEVALKNILSRLFFEEVDKASSKHGAYQTFVSERSAITAIAMLYHELAKEGVGIPVEIEVA